VDVLAELDRQARAAQLAEDWPRWESTVREARLQRAAFARLMGALKFPAMVDAKEA
jgi:hypothetical protein